MVSGKFWSFEPTDKPTMKNRRETAENIALNWLRLCVCAAALALLSGCTSPRSPEVRGRVLDAQTRAPVASAKVFFYLHSSISTKTDTQGYFHLKETSNFHLMRLPPGDGAWPSGTVVNEIRVIHPQYLPKDFRATWTPKTVEVLLVPRPE